MRNSKQIYALAYYLGDSRKGAARSGSEIVSSLISIAVVRVFSVYNIHFSDYSLLSLNEIASNWHWNRERDGYRYSAVYGVVDVKQSISLYAQQCRVAGKWYIMNTRIGSIP
ncbi:hypothetical protein EVAR_65352_1 [Eumeta japonica]|uniref:Uncharacterized protein n=1 Tax=Eumeta variegata TaxID=151549 RepID=A0A4C1Z0N7_EUMVA|nr:hypothetical protein EVAR_65352_1 [Eumeta japonica]